LAYGIYWWRGTKIVNFMVPGRWGRDNFKNHPKLINFWKSSSLQLHMWRKNWIHGDIDLE
jgi:hypothetical protein